MKSSARKFFASLLLLLISTTSHAGEHAEKAVAAMSAKNYRMAVVYYQRALKADPRDTRLKLGLAKSYELWGQTEKSGQVALEILAEDAGNIEALLLLGRLSVKQRDWAAAESVYRLVLSQNGGQLEAKTGLINALRAQQKNVEADKLANAGH